MLAFVCRGSRGFFFQISNRVSSNLHEISPSIYPEIIPCASFKVYPGISTKVSPWVLRKRSCGISHEVSTETSFEISPGLGGAALEVCLLSISGFVLDLYPRFFQGFLSEFFFLRVLQKHRVPPKMSFKDFFSSFAVHWFPELMVVILL